MSFVELKGHEDIRTGLFETSLNFCIAVCVTVTPLSPPRPIFKQYQVGFFGGL